MKIQEDLVCKNQDKFPLELRKKFVDATNYVLFEVDFTSWNSEKMKKLWRGRSLTGLLKDPEINHLFPCMDTTILGVTYLSSRGENVFYKILTAKGATKSFRENRASIMHIDSLIELEHNGVFYGLDIGCGDLTLLRPASRDEKISSEEENYFTTRPEVGEQIWTRSALLRVAGKTLLENPGISPMDFLNSSDNLVKVPYGITKEDIYSSLPRLGQEDVLTTNQKNYDPDASSRQNFEWIRQNKDFLPGMIQFCFR